MNILALDQSTVSTGWVYCVNEKIIAHGTILSPKSLKGVNEKIEYMCNSVANLLSTYPVDVCCIEDVQFQNSYRVYKVLAMLCGALVFICNSRGIKVDIVHPLTWKSVYGVCAKRRNEQKEMAIKMANEKYGLDVDTDEADAIGILYWAIEKYENSAQTNKKEGVI